MAKQSSEATGEAVPSQRGARHLGRHSQPFERAWSTATGQHF